MSGPLGNIPGMTYDPARNRYFPTPKGPIVIPTEEDTRSLPSPISGLGPSRYSSTLSASASAFSSFSSNAGSSRLDPRTGSHTRMHMAMNRSHAQAQAQGQAQSQQQMRSQEQVQNRVYANHPRRTDQMRNIEQLTLPQPECFSVNANLMKRNRSGSGSAFGKMDERSRLSRVGKIRKTGRFGIRYGGAAGQDKHLSTQDQILSDLEMDVEHHACGCHGEIITSYKAFGDEAYYATTDHGKLIMHHKNGNTAIFSVCAQNLVGLHHDVPRLTMIAIAGGPDPHLHIFKRDPENLDNVFMSHSELDLHRSEIYGVSSFDDICTIGGAKAITTVDYTSGVRSTPRRLPSDALALHQVSRDLVYVGQRSGNVSLEDLRVNTRHQNVVASTVKGKAVVGVKRLDDSAVPWGCIVSGMSHEMLLFDVRYGDKPLRVFEGHFNTFHSNVALATSPDDKTLFASSSDRRIKAWSTITGNPLIPMPKSKISASDFSRTGTCGLSNHAQAEDENPLTRVFKHRVSHLDVNDELGLDVVVKGDLLRFARK
ncbi:uncharacterized protein I303_100129 [Kwoniella dejecticola CBS 10117]|uniref:WD-repeat protein n=1 Tax=Kwoniella dejecticola CBS 10117 TaxID=1296121 RepID=A0A1A6AE67_9TREE|nr:uncharacterized protein I303_00129 [Kwoniella dejecticola CBS 10117]OBR88318.1 hypothetical protein I303_00129 [Kwoniella dejecticola CBS 10117]